MAAIKSKEPAVYKETVMCKGGECYEQYSINTLSGLIEELTLDDIIFIRDGLDEFIKEKLIKTPIVEGKSIKMPFEGDTEFIKMWGIWKTYLSLRFNKEYKPIEEKNVLEYLEEISDGDVNQAIKTIRFAMKEKRNKLYRIKTREEA